MTARRALRGTILAVGAVALVAIVVGALTMACAAGDLSTFMRGDAIACIGVLLLLGAVIVWTSVQR